MKTARLAFASLFSLVLTSHLQAQGPRSFSRYPTYLPPDAYTIPFQTGLHTLNMGPKADSLLKAHEVRTVEIQREGRHTRRNKSHRDSSFFRISEAGKLLERREFSFKRGRAVMHYHQILTYTPEGRPATNEWASVRANNVNKTTYTYNPAGKITAFHTTEGLQQKTVRAATMQYDDSNRLIRRTNYSGSKEKSRWEYTYFPDGQLASSTMLVRNKVKYQENHTCQPAGAPAGKKESFVCREKITLPNGQRLEIWNTDNKSKPNKSVFCFDSSNRLLYEEHYQGEAWTRYAVYRRFDGDSMRERRINRYSEKDSIETHITYVYPALQPVIETQYRIEKGRKVKVRETRRGFAGSLPTEQHDDYLNTGMRQTVIYRFQSGD
jgi:YD repeat-containing protein